MAYSKIKTEHTGPKRQRGSSYWGRRKEAKDESRRARRKLDRRAIQEQQ